MLKDYFNSVISVLDDEKTVEKKIKKYGFSGAMKTLEDHKKYGADVEVDISCQYLKFFMEDKEKMEGIVKDYKEGKVGTGFVKGELAKCVNKFLGEYQKRRLEVSDSDIEEFMKIRRIRRKNKLNHDRI